MDSYVISSHHRAVLVIAEVVNSCRTNRATSLEEDFTNDFDNVLYSLSLRASCLAIGICFGVILQCIATILFHFYFQLKSVVRILLKVNLCSYLFYYIYKADSLFSLTFKVLAAFLQLQQLDNPQMVILLASFENNLN